MCVRVNYFLVVFQKPCVWPALTIAECVILRKNVPRDNKL